MQFKVSKGLNVPINGSINVERINSVSARSVALLGEDYHGLKPTMLVQEGNVVIKGQNLFEDKKNPGVKFTSPISGKIVEINRGCLVYPSPSPRDLTTARMPSYS